MGILCLVAAVAFFLGSWSRRSEIDILRQDLAEARAEASAANEALLGSVWRAQEKSLEIERGMKADEWMRRRQLFSDP